jgi:hypothetical protein
MQGEQVIMTPSRPPLQPFVKPWLPYPDQVALLEKRGLLIADPAAAADFLSHINYYRFSGYCLAFEQARHQFIPNTTFEQVRTPASSTAFSVISLPTPLK